MRYDDAPPPSELFADEHPDYAQTVDAYRDDMLDALPARVLRAARRDPVAHEEIVDAIDRVLATWGREKFGG